VSKVSFEHGQDAGSIPAASNNMTKYRRPLRKDGKPFAETLSGWRLLREKDGAPYYIWVGKKKVKHHV